MKKLSLRSGLLATTTICGAALSTMTGGALVATVATMLPTVAQAQDYTSGALLGTVTDAGGAPVVGATVVLTSEATGQVQNLKTDSAGQFSATGLPSGVYDYVVSANGYDDANGTATVIISQEVRYSIAMQTTGATQTVVVRGKRVRQDFTKTTTGLTVDLATLVAQQPIARNLTAVTMLAPTVSKGNPGFGNVASFGGGSVAENAYYIDGLNITNPDTYVGGARVPFDFYKTIEVKTGGYQAEFGRATGGVVNATTKSGTNEFTFGVHGNYQPSELRADQLDTRTYRGKYTEVQDNSLVLEAGGPLIKDHLFAYGLYEINDYNSRSAAYNAGTYTNLKNTDPFYGIKLDGYITPTQHLSLTYFDTTNTDHSAYYKFSDDDGIGVKTGTAQETYGGKSWVFNYKGKVTDWLSISAAYGDMKDQDTLSPSNTVDYYVNSYFDSDGNYQGKSSRISANQASSTMSIDAYERKFYRLDGDLNFNILGRHHVRFGYDHEENSMDKIATLPGEVPLRYTYYPDPDDESDNPAELLLATYERLGGHVSAENSAWYVQDSWDITSNFNIQVGVRNDDFTQNNLSGEQYLDLSNNIAPRLGFSWDPTGDGVWKIYGSAGANFIPPAMNLGFRGKDLYYQELFDAPAGGWDIDSTTGLPSSVGAAHPAASIGFDSPCPESDIANAPGMSSASGNTGVAACGVYGNGDQEGANSKTALGLQATEEDEVILGTTYRANDLWTFGLSYTWRDLKRVSEDSDFQDAIIAYLDANGLDYTPYIDGTITNSYYVWNVGDHDVTIRLKDPLPGETDQRVITLTADQLGHFRDAKRNYQALVFDFKRAFDGKWGLEGSYTLSRSYGNYEGTVKSDAGDVQQDDAGATIAFDAPGFEDYATGLLPNDHTHTLKVWGSYAVTPSLLVGANIMVQSPTHFGCMGYHPTDAYAASYGAVSHFCDGEPAPQGKGLKSDWTKNIDVSMRYTVPEKYAAGGNLILRADIFNLFDTHSVVGRSIEYETSGPGVHSSEYGMPTYYNTPRYVRLGFDLTY